MQMRLATVQNAQTGGEDSKEKPMEVEPEKGTKEEAKEKRDALAKRKEEIQKHAWTM